MRNILIIISLSVCMLFNSHAVLSAENDAVEYKLKAAYMLNFAKFINWPQERDEGDTFRICIYGNNPFGSALAGAESKKIKGKAVKLVLTSNPEDLDDCRLVFISPSEANRVKSILKKISGKPIVAISDVKGFATAGGTIEFVSVGNKLRFVINYSQAKSSNVKITASLLGLAVEVL